MLRAMARLIAFISTFSCLRVTPLLAQTSAPEIEQVSLIAFLAMCGFVLLAALIVLSVIAQGLVGYGIVPKAGRLRQIMLWLTRVVSNVEVKDGGPNDTRTGSKGWRL
jgi:hypothetical protein